MIGASSSIFVLSLTGCATTGGTAAGVGLGAGAIVGTVVGVATGDARIGAAAGLGAGLLAGVITYHVVESRKRKAAEAEAELARQRAQQRKQDLTAIEQREIRDSNAHLAVAVGETETEQLVMIVDPATGQPVDDQVHSVPKQSIEELKSGGTVSATPQPAPSASSTTPPTTSSGGAQTQSSPAAGPVTADAAGATEQIRFGTLGGEKVIFRL